MQGYFSCVPPTFSGVEASLSAARLGRYLGEAGGDKHYALRLYLWNARLCESLYLPTQICEVTLRNAIHKAVALKHGPKWYERGGFLCTLPDRLRAELNDAIVKERMAHGAATDANHLVSALSFGFWQHLLTPKYKGVFWPNYFRDCFPHKPAFKQLEDLYAMADTFRTHRNRLAHHKPIFDRYPTNELANILILISWVCGETRWFAEEVCTLASAQAQKPQH